MPVVNVDLSEYDAIRNRVKELEEQVKEQKETIKSLKDGSRVILRREQVIQIERCAPSMYEQMMSRSQPCYQSDTKERHTIETSEQYINFEDVRLKVEEKMKTEVERSIRERDEARDKYNKRMDELDEKYMEQSMTLENEYDDKHGKLKKEYEEKQEKLSKEYEEKEKALKNREEAFVNEHSLKLVQYDVMLNNLRDYQCALEDAIKLYNSNRIFKPKGIGKILGDMLSSVKTVIHNNVRRTV